MGSKASSSGMPRLEISSATLEKYRRLRSMMPFRICAARDTRPASGRRPAIRGAGSQTRCGCGPRGSRRPRLPRLSRRARQPTAGGGIATSGFRSSSSRRTGSEPGDPVPPALPPEQEGVNGNAVGNTQKVSGRAGRKGRTRPGMARIARKAAACRIGWNRQAVALTGSLAYRRRQRCGRRRRRRDRCRCDRRLRKPARSPVH